MDHLVVQDLRFKYCIPTDQIENRTLKMFILRFKFILYGNFDSCFIFKTPITQNSKITCFANWRSDNSKSRYWNDLKFIMAFLDKWLYQLLYEFSINEINKNYFEKKKYKKIHLLHGYAFENHYTHPLKYHIAVVGAAHSSVLCV